jgi:hypothetical protein
MKRQLMLGFDAEPASRSPIPPEAVRIAPPPLRYGPITALDGALWLHSQGLAPVALRARGETCTRRGEIVVSDGKVPRHEAFGTVAAQATADDLRADFAAHPDSGLGVLLGVLPPGRDDNPYWGRRGVADVEVDDPELAAPVLKRLWPGGLPDTLRWESNGPGRWHRLFWIDHKVAQALRDLGFKSTYKGLRRTPDGQEAGDAAYAGLEFRFGSLHPGVISQIQSVCPPTPRFDGTPRAFVGEVILPFPERLIKDLAEHSACARRHAEDVARAKQPREPLPREQLVGLPPLEMVRAQLKQLRLPARVGQSTDGQRVIYAACPSCEGPRSNPSARFAEKSHRGKLIVDCYRSGCDLDEIMESLGLFAGDIYPSAEAARKVRVVDMIRRGVSNIHWDGPATEYGLSEEDIERFESEADRCSKALATMPEVQTDVARLLGVSAETFDVLHAGYRAVNHFKDKNGAWAEYGAALVFPMVDGEGRCVNLQRRWLNDASRPKMGLSGGRQGLFVPSGWRDRPGPPFLVEGASDVLNLWELGLAAVGRPNNRDGARFAATLLRETDRELVVVGERDEKPDGRWPGDPSVFALDLGQRLGRPVKTILPPSSHKDVRAWRSAVADDQAVRAELLRLAAAAKTVTDRPPDEPLAKGGFVIKIALPKPVTRTGGRSGS